MMPGSTAVIAHRGSSAAEPENTMRAFRAADAAGADLIELDVRVSRDGVPVVVHDAGLGSGAGRASVSELSCEEISARRPEPRIPELEEVLCWARSRIETYLELKATGVASSVVRLVSELEMQDQVLIGSFHPSEVARVRELDSGLPTSVLSAHTDPGQVLRLGERLGANYVHLCWERAHPEPHRLLGQGLVEAARRSGMGVILWQEDRRRVLERLLEYEPDGICTNVPERLVAVREEYRKTRKATRSGGVAPVA
ncbi:glycerophosphodiester phosphodiesterase [Rubrobacter taiwanensis]|uniref:Glycerophosphodiester phosphodiesterase n=2 Tax=Rubrobacter taiwanensis TaxID=185139 RepID=A0A4R1BJ51_9ACTN|nr:glycerophosphodiester phosphodiesterase [Rubrobacter taiwanensis]